MYAKIEFSRLQYLRFNQSKLCTDLYQGLAWCCSCIWWSSWWVTVRQKSYPSFVFHRWSQVPSSAVPRCNGYCVSLWETRFLCSIYIQSKMAKNNQCFVTQTTAENWQDIVARVFKLKLKSFYMTCSMGKNCLRQNGCINICHWVAEVRTPHTHTLGICDIMQTSPRQ